MNLECPLLDEASRNGFRARFGALAAASDCVDVAATRVRLTLVNLSAGELGGLKLLRVLLAEVNAFRMAAEAEAVLADPGRAGNVRLLLELLRAGRIQVRSAPMGGWAPDFSVFHRESVAWAALVGVHSFQHPSPFPGPIFVSEHRQGAATLAARRFESIWTRSHDVSEPVLGLLSSAADPEVLRTRARGRSHRREPVVPQGDIGPEDA